MYLEYLIHTQARTHTLAFTHTHTVVTTLTGVHEMHKCHGYVTDLLVHVVNLCSSLAYLP